MEEIRILIADHVRPHLAGHPNWTVIGEAATEAELLAATNEAKPDIVVMDITTDALGTLETAKKIRALNPNTRIIVLSPHEEEFMIRAALQAGVHGYISKSEFSREIVPAVHAVCEGRRFVDDRGTEVVIKSYLEAAAGINTMPIPPSRLTARELEIVRLLALGNGNKLVATVLGISVRTVETHRANVMRKLALHTLAELIHYAVSRQIIYIHPTPSTPTTNESVAR